MLRAHPAYLQALVGASAEDSIVTEAFSWPDFPHRVLRSCVETAQALSMAVIGETAGSIWHTLEETGPLTVTKLVKSVDAPRDVVMQALGWLAREDKIEVTETNRSKIVALR